MKFFSEKEKDKSCNEFINIKDIREDCLYTKDNKVIAYLKIEPINLDLLSIKEKQQLIKQISSELSSETKELKFFSIARPIDISEMIDDLQNYILETNDQKQKDLLKKQMKECIKLTLTGVAVQRQNYLMIWENENDYAKKDLLKRANDLINKFAGCRIKSTILNEQQIIQLCSSFTNMNWAYKEDADCEDYIPSIEMLRKED